MNQSFKKEDEKKRLEEVNKFIIYESRFSKVLNEITYLAAHICQTPIALISLINENDQLSFANFGKKIPQTHRNIAFCSYAMLSPNQLFIIEKANKDPRFYNHPLVHQPPHIQFYAGAPLLSLEGFMIGTLCVMSHHSIKLNRYQKKSLLTLSHYIMVNFELKKNVEKINQLSSDLNNLSNLIEKQKIHLEKYSRLASLGEHAAEISHEINNPLSIILYKSDLLLEILQEKKTVNIKTIQNSLEVITEQSLKASKIIKGLKALSKNSEEEPKKQINIHEIIYSIYDFYEEKLKKNGIKFLLDIHTTSGKFNGRSTQIGQVITNLLNNALDAVKEVQNRWIQLKVIEEKGYLQVCIVDSGKGIDRFIQEKVMEPFFTTKSFGKGTGIGLSISKRIAEDHGGQLYFDVQQPHTTVILQIPTLQENFDEKAA